MPDESMAEEQRDATKPQEGSPGYDTYKRLADLRAKLSPIADDINRFGKAVSIIAAAVALIGALALWVFQLLSPHWNTVLPVVSTVSGAIVVRVFYRYQQKRLFLLPIIAFTVCILCCAGATASAVNATSMMQVFPWWSSVVMWGAIGAISANRLVYDLIDKILNELLDTIVTTSRFAKVTADAVEIMTNKIEDHARVLSVLVKAKDVPQTPPEETPPK